MAPARLRLVYLIPAGVNLAVVVLLVHYVFSQWPRDGSQRHATQVPPGCAHCPADPFTQPGMLHWSTAGMDNETRWIPFPQAWHDWEAQPMAYDLPSTDVIPAQAWESAPHQFVARMEQGETFEWMRGRTILFVGGG